MAEEIVYGERSTGAVNDFEQAARLARKLIGSGLSPLGVVDEKYTPKSRIHRVFQEILEEQTKRVTSLLKVRKELLRQIAEVLFNREKISGDFFRELLRKGAGQEAG